MNNSFGLMESLLLSHWQCSWTVSWAQSTVYVSVLLSTQGQMGSIFKPQFQDRMWPGMTLAATVPRRQPWLLCPAAEGGGWGRVAR